MNITGPVVNGCVTVGAAAGASAGSGVSASAVAPTIRLATSDFSSFFVSGLFGSKA